MSKRSGKELHPLFNSWAGARRLDCIGDEWRDDFWRFVKDVGGERPENTRLKRVDESKKLGPDNFEWREIKQSFKDFPSQAEYMREYRKRNPEALKDIELRRSYGITFHDYKRMAAQQNHVCAICGGEETAVIRGRRLSLAVDHCHTTGKVRGLLCVRCNQGIGQFHEDVSLFASAAKYLESHA